MADPFLIQKQIKDNSEDLHNFVRDLKLWEEEMKRKDRQLSNEEIEEVLPPIRRCKSTEKPKVDKREEFESKRKRIAAHDYKAWEKFDVDKACEEVDSKDSNTEKDETDDDLEKQEETYLKEKALYEKELGNKHVKACQWDKAVESYTRAISAYSRDPIFFANRALCYLKKKQYKLVESDCTESLKLDPTYVKALMRRAAAREALGRLEDARHDLTQVLQLEPNNVQAQKDLTRVKTAVSLGESKGKDTSTKHAPTKQNTISTKPELPTQPNSMVSKVDSTSLSPTSKEMDDEPNWPTNEATVEPIVKPPHLRSKKSLKRIEIYDVGMNALNHVCPRNVTRTQNSTIKQPDKKQPLIVEETSSPKQKSIFTVSTGSTTSSVKNVPPPPKTSIQFHQSWNSIKTDKSLCFQFLKQIQGENLPGIFKESLESRMFSSIIDILSSEFVAANEPVLPYLRGLSNVRRFSTIVLFMSPSDKSGVSALLEYCLSHGEASQEDIRQLRSLYRI